MVLQNKLTWKAGARIKVFLSKNFLSSVFLHGMIYRQGIL